MREERLPLGLPFGLFLALMALAAWVRAAGLGAMGLEGSDESQYWHIATAWSRGDIVWANPATGDVRTFFRPVAFFVYSAAVRLMGSADWALKAVNVACDLGALVMVFAIGRRVRDAWTGLFAAAAYAFLPLVVFMVRTELLHAMSGLWVALTVWAALRTLDARGTLPGVLFAALGGVFMVCGALTHPDMAFVAPGLLIGLGAALFSERGAAYGTRDFLLLAGVFSVVFFGLFAGAAALFGTDVVARAYFDPAKVASGGGGGFFPVEVFRHLKTYLTEYPGTHLFLFLLVPAVAGTVAATARDRRAARLFPLLLAVASFILLHVLLTKTGRQARLFMPLLPAALLCVIEGVRRGLELLAGRNPLPGLAAAAALALFPAYLGLYVEDGLARSLRPPRQSVYRVVHDRLADKVGPNARLLVAPHEIYYTEGFNIPPYFGGNAVYARRLDRPWAEALARHGVRYVFFIREKTAPENWTPRPESVSLYGVPGATLDARREYDLIRELAGPSATVLMDDDYGVILDLGARGDG